MTALTLPGALLPDAMGREDVARAAAGDMAAFERLYRSHVARIHSLVRRMAGPGEADDLTQDIFLRAWSRLGTFRGESAFGTWLHRLAVNIVVERLRSPAARLRWVDDDDLLQGVAPTWVAGRPNRSRGGTGAVAARRARHLRASRRRGAHAPGDCDVAWGVGGNVQGAVAPGTNVVEAVTGLMQGTTHERYLD